MRVIVTNSYSLIKTAEPYFFVSCPNKECKKNWLVDLRWERPGEGISYHAIDEKGKMMDAVQSAKAITERRQIIKEWSKEGFKCPACGIEWIERPVRDPQTSYTTREVGKQIVPQLPPNIHRPNMLPA